MKEQVKAFLAEYPVARVKSNGRVGRVKDCSVRPYNMLTRRSPDHVQVWLKFDNGDYMIYNCSDVEFTKA